MESAVLGDLLVTRRVLGAVPFGSFYDSLFVPTPVIASVVPGSEVWMSGGFITTQNNNSAALAINTLTAIPLYVARQMRIDRLGFVVGVVGGAGSVARIGIYNSDSTTRYPTTRLFDGGEFACDAAAGGKITTLDLLLQPDLYWIVYLSGVAAPSVLRVANDNYNPIYGQKITAAGVSKVFQLGFTVAQAYGPLPVSFPAGAALAEGTGLALGWVRLAGFN